MLHTHSTLTVETPEGPHQIQLLFGDITALPVEEKVDVIIVSAFAGDYAATRTSVIGALSNKLGISVRKLSQDREEDLRRSFNCWWSKPLPQNVPYRRLLCFETPHTRTFKHPAELVSNVFRCLVPVLKNDEKTVITPLLSTGDQCFSKQRMMHSMIEAAVSWIRAGLPLKCLKIVLYKQDADSLHFYEEEQALISLFNSMKSKVEASQATPMEEDIKYDIYLSYDEKDTGRVEEIKNKMLQNKSDIRIFADHQNLDAEVSFQKDIHSVMRRCRRIVTFLSPAYLQSEGCLEQYNIAMCCNRKTKRHLLAPFYIETIMCMPTYMQLVQYIDCRNPEKFIQGISSFVAVFQTSTRQSLLKPLSTHYDVFISYSHRNPEKAKAILDIFKKLNSEMSIFFDKDDLQTGSSWQQSLYNALDNSDVVIALLSPDYLASQVCNEEYNIALAKHASEDHETELIPVMVESMCSIPKAYAEVKILDATLDYEQVINRLCHAVHAYHQRKLQKDEDIFNDLKNPFDIPNLMEEYRKCLFEKKYDFKDGVISPKGLQPSEINDQALSPHEKAHIKNTSENHSSQEVSKTDLMKSKEGTSKYDVAFICADHKYAYFLDSLLRVRVPKLTTNIDVQVVKQQMECLDSAQVVVPILTQNFVKSGKHIDELHVSLARHRKTFGQTVLYPVQVTHLPKWPTYIHLIPCAVAAHDDLWKEFIKKSYRPELALPADVQNLETSVVKKLGQNFASELMLALSVACDDIITILKKKSDNDCRNTILHNIAQIELEVGQHCSTMPECTTKGVALEKVLKNIQLVPPSENINKTEGKENSKAHHSSTGATNVSRQQEKVSTETSVTTRSCTLL